eukprot:6811820-Alexandrium_andersonii.AAC.1
MPSQTEMRTTARCGSSSGPVALLTVSVSARLSSAVPAAAGAAAVAWRGRAVGSRCSGRGP